MAAHLLCGSAAVYRTSSVLWGPYLWTDRLCANTPSRPDVLLTYQCTPVLTRQAALQCICGQQGVMSLQTCSALAVCVHRHASQLISTPAQPFSHRLALQLRRPCVFIDWYELRNEHLAAQSGCSLVDLMQFTNVFNASGSRWTLRNMAETCTLCDLGDSAQAGRFESCGVEVWYICAGPAHSRTL